MIAFETGNNVIGTFPNTAAKNVSGAGATDGTALLANWVQSLWGAFQDLMQRAGLTPSGVAEAYAAETGVLPLGGTGTQFRTAMQMAFGSPGELVLWCRSQAPATVGARVLLLQGQTITIASAKDLVAATYCGDGVNNTAGVPFYKSSDAGGVTRDIAGTYFTLPDARGVTIRGIDVAAARDPQGATRGAGTPNGSIQQDAFQGWQLGATADATGARNYWGSTEQRDYVQSPTNNTNFTPLNMGTLLQGVSRMLKAVSDGGVTYEGKVNQAVRVSVETRMINMACYVGIRY